MPIIGAARTEHDAEPEHVGRKEKRRVQRDERDVERRLRLAAVPQPHTLLHVALALTGRRARRP